MIFLFLLCCFNKFLSNLPRSTCYPNYIQFLCQNYYKACADATDQDVLAPTRGLVLPRPICQATCAGLQVSCSKLLEFMSTKMGVEFCAATRGEWGLKYPKSIQGMPYLTGSEINFPETTETLTVNGSSYTTTCANATRPGNSSKPTDTLDTTNKLHPAGCIPVAQGGVYWQNVLACNFPCKYTWSNLTVASQKLTAWYLA